ncbi:MAG: radical SAM protein [Candidatus Thorarchaeota archaeon]|nr:radical SAM protein [Candidatus Thorarchaeota archaeon]
MVIWKMSPEEKLRIHLVAINPDRYSLPIGYLHCALSHNSRVGHRIDVRSFVYDVDQLSSPYFDFSTIIFELTKDTPGIIGWSTYLWNQSIILDLSRIISRIYPRIRMVFGGPQFRAVTESWDLFPRNSIFVLGEGERTLIEIAEAVLNESPIEGIEGTAVRISDGWKMLVQKEPIDLEELESPFQHGIVEFGNTDGIVAYSTSRGCIYRCGYCQWGDGLGLRYFPLDVVQKDLDELRKHKIERIWFVDSLFGADEGRYSQVLDWLQDWPNDCSFSFETRAEFVTQQIAEKMAKLNVEWIALGVQSINEKILAEVNRYELFEDVRKGVERLVSAGIKEDSIHLDIIFGLPGDSVEGMHMTVNTLNSSFPNATIFFEVLRVLPGTAIKKQAEDENWVVNSAERFYEVVESPHISFSNIVSIKKMGLGLDFLQMPRVRSLLRGKKWQMNMTYSELCLAVGSNLWEHGFGRTHEYERFSKMEKLLDSYSSLDSMICELEIALGMESSPKE